MKTLEKMLSKTEIQIIRENFQPSYEGGITIEIGGPLRYTDPTIWAFKTEKSAIDFITEIFAAFKITEALDILGYHIGKYKSHNPGVFGDIENSKKAIKSLLRCAGYSQESSLSVIVDMNLCGRNYDIVVEERLGWWLHGSVSNSACYHCKNCTDKLYNKTGYMSCDTIASKILPEEYPQMFTIGNNVELGCVMDIKTGDLYTSLRLSPVDRSCKCFVKRKTWLEGLKSFM